MIDRVGYLFKKQQEKKTTLQVILVCSLCCLDFANQSAHMDRSRISFGEFLFPGGFTKSQACDTSFAPVTAQTSRKHSRNARDDIKHGGTWLLLQGRRDVPLKMWRIKLSPFIFPGIYRVGMVGTHTKANKQVHERA